MDYDPGVQAYASARHAAAVDQELPREIALANEAVTICIGLVDFMRYPRVAEEANTLAAWLCFRRAAEQLRTAHFLAYLGHYSEVALLVRGVYESAGLARKLAVEPEAADRWVQEGTWHPDRDVRAWVRDHGGDAEVSREFYRHASDASHTTWLSTAPFLAELADEETPICVNVFDERYARQSLLGVVGAGLFIAHCVRNAVVDEVVLPIELRQRIVALHEAAGNDAEHLHQDWDEVARRQDQLAERVNRAEGLDQRLADDPLSYDNVVKGDHLDPET